MEQQDFNRAQLKWAIVAGIGTTLAFIITGIIGIWSLIRQQNHEQHLEFQKAMLNEQLVTYKEACRAAGTVIMLAEIKSDSLPQAVSAFNRIYWGDMALVENEQLVEAGKRFRLACDDYQRSARRDDDLNQLKEKAADFTSVCKKATTEEWQKILHE
jgi:hypothetical protein